MPAFKPLSRYLLGVLFIGAGLNHFWHTGFYLAMMPPYLPWHGSLVYASGIAEAGVGALLLFRRWQVPGAWGIIAVSLAVFPANVQMALHPELFPQFSPLGLWLRLPLQLVPVVWAWCFTRDTAQRRS